MKQVPFKELELDNKTIVAVDASCVNRVILTTETIDGYINYYWLYADTTSYGISYPVLYELTEEEADRYLESSVAALN